MYVCSVHDRFLVLQHDYKVSLHCCVIFVSEPCCVVLYSRQMAEEVLRNGGGDTEQSTGFEGMETLARAIELGEGWGMARAIELGKG